MVFYLNSPLLLACPECLDLRSGVGDWDPGKDHQSYIFGGPTVLIRTCRHSEVVWI